MTQVQIEPIADRSFVALALARSRGGGGPAYQALEVVRRHGAAVVRGLSRQGIYAAARKVRMKVMVVSHGDGWLVVDPVWYGEKDDERVAGGQAAG